MPEKEKETKTIELPEPKTKGALSLEECIQKRRSRRNFISDPLSLEQISQLLWSMQGITEPERGFRAAPSAGALYPLEIYVLKSDGVFHYTPEGHILESLGKEDLRKNLGSAALGQTFIAHAPVNFVICAVLDRVTSRYRERGIMYAHIEVGHAAQNLHLQAVALGLDSVPVGAFREEAVSETLSLPVDHKPLYIIPVGRSGR
ncbi:SagB/ThcOx family dehydrogenase [Candidatus Sumerlaeota bacterium]|nr:SagB/ThcOx family dehydrogenase [Candidatus Sumerlaeota bacterium]